MARVRHHEIPVVDLDGTAAPPAPGADAAIEFADEPRRFRPTRREVLGAFLAGGLGVAVGRRLPRGSDAAAPTPSAAIDADDGLLDLGPLPEVLTATERGPMPWPSYAPVVMVVAFDPSVPGAAEAYPAHLHAHVTPNLALMAIRAVDPDTGCRLGWCESSQNFEGACNGERFNAWGEVRPESPGRVSLVRWASFVDESGHVIVDPDRSIAGPQFGRGVLDEEPTGPHCFG